jgi:hypothetical protein
VTFSLHYSFITKMTQKINGSCSCFQEDSNMLKYVLFWYCMNKLWYFWSFNYNFFKNVSRHLQKYDLVSFTTDVHLCIAIVCSLHCMLACFAYSQKWDSHGFRKTTLVGVTTMYCKLLKTTLQKTLLSYGI